jgi:hypothetical protein
VALVASQPQPPATESERGPVSAPRQKSKPKLVAATIPITIRPDEELLKCYTLAAAERTKRTGKVVSAQQIMMEVLERDKTKVLERETRANA